MFCFKCNSCGKAPASYCPTSEELVFHLGACAGFLAGVVAMLVLVGLFYL